LFKPAAAVAAAAAAAAAAAFECPQMAQLEAEVAAKQQQLQQLAAENASLTAKARVLDQLVASAGMANVESNFGAQFLVLHMHQQRMSASLPKRVCWSSWWHAGKVDIG
jgi:hypothetical protein